MWTQEEKRGQCGTCDFRGRDKEPRKKKQVLVGIDGQHNHMRKQNGTHSLEC